jgi:hypothetical protein
MSLELFAFLLQVPFIRGKLSADRLLILNQPGESLALLLQLFLLLHQLLVDGELLLEQLLRLDKRLLRIDFDLVERCLQVLGLVIEIRAELLQRILYHRRLLRLILLLPQFSVQLSQLFDSMVQIVHILHLQTKLLRQFLYALGQLLYLELGLLVLIDVLLQLLILDVVTFLIV